MKSDDSVRVILQSHRILHLKTPRDYRPSLNNNLSLFATFYEAQLTEIVKT